MVNAGSTAVVMLYHVKQCPVSSYLYVSKLATHVLLSLLVCIKYKVPIIDTDTAVVSKLQSTSLPGEA